MEEQFTVLENKAIGRNISMFRKIREMKAADVASSIGISETAYTKYERGETQITIDFIQKVSTALKVDPMQLISVTPSNYIESIQNNYSSPGIGIGNKVEISGDFHSTDEKQATLIVKLIENVMAMNESVMDMSKKIIALLDKK